jgi:hypothetical protein
MVNNQIQSANIVNNRKKPLLKRKKMNAQDKNQ